MPPMVVSSALSAGCWLRGWQAACDDEAVFGRRGRGIIAVKPMFYFSAGSCYIHCYIAACVCFCRLPAWATPASSTRGFSPPVSLLSSPSAHHHPPALAAGTADLRKPNSDSCRYEPLMSVAHKKTCTPSQPPPLPWYSVPRLPTTTGPLLACHLASPRQAAYVRRR